MGWKTIYSNIKFFIFQLICILAKMVITFEPVGIFFMRFSMLYSGERILSFKSCLVFYAGDSLNMHYLVKICVDDHKTVMFSFGKILKFGCKIA